MEGELRLYNVTELLGKSAPKLLVGNEGHSMSVQNQTRRGVININK